MHICKVVLKNYKKFKYLAFNLSDGKNIIIGDNESGKSTILEAISLAISGSKYKVDKVGIDHIFNNDVTNNFINGDSSVQELPEVRVDIYMENTNESFFWGKNNLEETEAYGVTMLIKPNNEHLPDIIEVLNNEHPSFPYDFYKVEFYGFSGNSFNAYSKPVKHILYDNTQLYNEKSLKEYIKSLFHSTCSQSEMSKLQHIFKSQRSRFTDENLIDAFAKTPYQFTLESLSHNRIDNSISITNDGIDIRNRGKGEQLFTMLNAALDNQNDIDIVLLEEPENHLSYHRMNTLITTINDSKNDQVIVSTHNNMVCSRLELNKAVFLGKNGEVINFNEIPEKTVKFFQKYPFYSILEFILADKVLLVEGRSEFILFKEFIKKVLPPNKIDTVHVISAETNTVFKYFLNIAKLLNIKCAVVTDNDGNKQENCIDKYSDYESDENIKIFYHEDENITTFEYALYEDNKRFLEEAIGSPRRTDLAKYMIKNKTSSAMQILENFDPDRFSIPEYIKNSIEWVNK